MLLELEDELKQIQDDGGVAEELRRKLADRDAELAALRRKLNAAKSGGGESSSSAATIAALQEDNDALLDRQAELENEVQNAKDILEETTEEMERMQQILEQRDTEDTDDRVGMGKSRRARYEARLEELEEKLHESAEREKELEAGIKDRDRQNEMLSDLNDRMKAELKEIDRRREEAHLDRSVSRAEAFEEREEREALEEVPIISLRSPSPFNHSCCISLRNST